MKFLLDTCVISELMAKRPNQAVMQWIDSVDEDRLYLSVITIGEIRKGIAKLADSTRKLELQEWLSDHLLSRFNDSHRRDRYRRDVGLGTACGQPRTAWETDATDGFAHRRDCPARRFCSRSRATKPILSLRTLGC